jgi:transcriptional regulator with XRE-family HTH domain
MAEVAYIGPGGRGRRTRPLLRTTLGAVLRRHRLAQGRTLADVAGDARVSLPYLSELERGRKEGSSEVLAAVCDALGVELSDVVTEAGRGLARDRAVLRRPLSPSAEPAQQTEPLRDLRARSSQGQSRISAPVRGSGDVLLLAA